MRAHGEVILGSLESDRTASHGTLQCCHCGRHWIVQPGSGRQRGYCTRCGAVTCGPDCPAGQGCTPQEQFLENLAAGRPADFYPTQVNVPRLWLPGD